MSVDKLGASLYSLTQSHNGRLIFGGQDDFAAKLTLGQVIKAKVLRQYEGGKYVVDFGGQEKVVDTTIPLKPGELIEGRVKSLGKQVEIQRLDHFAKLDGGSLDKSQSELSFSPLQDQKAQTILKYFVERQSAISEKEIQILRHFVSNKNPLPVLMLVGLGIKKMGLEITRAHVDLVLSKLHPAIEKQSLVEPLLSLDAAAPAEEANIATQKETVDVLSKVVAYQAEQYLDNETTLPASESIENNFLASSDDGQSDNNKDQRAYQLLNVQDDSAVQHRLVNLPIWLDGRLIEISMALFDQQESQSNPMAEHDFRRFVFNLKLEQLGKVTASGNIHGRNINLVLSSEDVESTELMSRYMTPLINTLENLGWVVDKVEYATEYPGFDSAVLSIVEHYASKDSMSRVF